MVFESRNSSRSFVPGISAGESIADQRARIAHEAAEREERRQADLAEQSSIRNAPASESVSGSECTACRCHATPSTTC